MIVKSRFASRRLRTCSAERKYSGTTSSTPCLCATVQEEISHSIVSYSKLAMCNTFKKTSDY